MQLRVIVTKIITILIIISFFSGCDSKKSNHQKVLSAYEELIEDIAGNKNNKPISADELNSIDGISGAIDGVDYSKAFMEANFLDPSNPTIDEIQSVIDSVNKKYLEEKSFNNIKDFAKGLTTKAPTLQDYKNLGLDNINQDNINDINSKLNLLTLKDFNSVDDIKNAISNLKAQIDNKKALDKIYTFIKDNNSTTLSVDDYKNAGIDGVTSENIDKINEIIKDIDPLNTNNLKEIIKDAVIKIAQDKKESLKKIHAFIKGDSDIKPTINDYKNFGVDGVDESNLEKINNFIKNNKNLDSIDSIKKAIKEKLKELNKKQSFTEKIKDIIENNGTEPTLDDFKDIGIDGVNEDNIDKVNEIIKNIDTTKIDNFDNLNEVINKGINSLETIDNFKKDDSNTTTPTIDDYKNIGIDNVDENNIKQINNAIKDNNFSSIKEIQDIVDNINKTIDATNKIKDFANDNNNSSPTLQDYIDAKISGVNEDNLDEVNKIINKNKIDSIDKIENTIDSINKFKEFINNNGSLPTTNDYKNLGINSVTKDNLQSINSYIKENPIDSIDKLEVAVNKAIKKITALNKIKNFLNDNTLTPTLQDYQDMDISGVNEDNIDFINHEIANKSIDKIDTAKKIQDIVNSAIKQFNAINKIKDFANDNNNSSPTLQDYIDAKISGVSEDNLDEINNIIANKNSSNVDSTDKINNIINSFNKIDSFIKGDSNIEPTLQDFTTINLKDINNNNLNKILNTIKNSKISINSLQNVIDDINKEIKAFNKIKDFANSNGLTPTLQEYIDAKISGVNEDNLDEINSIIRKSDINTLDDIKNIVNSYNNLIDFAIKKHNTPPILQDYKNLGFTNVTLKNINNLNIALKNGTFSSFNEITIAINSTVKQIDAINKIKEYANDSSKSAPTIQDYIDAKVYGVDDKIIDKLNETIASKEPTEVDTTQKIQEIVSSIKFSIKSLTPAPNSSNIDGSNRVITIEYKYFDKKIKKVPNKGIRVYKANGNIEHTVSINSEITDTTTIDGSKVNVNLSSHLVYGAKHYVKIDTSAFIDESNFTNKGIKDNQTWSFIVPSGSGPCGCDEFDNSDLDENLQ